MLRESIPVVVDASVVFKWEFDDEEYVSQARALRDDYHARGAIILIAPPLLVYEVVNGITIAIRQKRIAREKAAEAMCNILALGIELREVEPLAILEVAIRHNLAAYDAAYLALAEAENCDLWTGDRAFYQVVRHKAPRVKWVGEYAGKGRPAM